MSKYYITIGDNKYDLATLIDTSGTSITSKFTGFPNSILPACELEKLKTDINYIDSGTSLMNKCRVKSYSTNTATDLSFTIPPGINKMSGFFASPGGGGGGGGATVNAVVGGDKNNDSGAGGGGGGGGCLVVLDNYPVTFGDTYTINIGNAGSGSNSITPDNYRYNGTDANALTFKKNTETLLIVGGGKGGNAGANGNANVIGRNTANNEGNGGAGGTIGTNTIPSTYINDFNGNAGSRGDDAPSRETAGKGGNGGTCSNNSNINSNYNSYTTTSGSGSSQNTNGVGQIGGNAPSSSPTIFSGGGGGGSGSGNDDVFGSKGGYGGMGFAIVYLYF
jgi:hypothetical protein